MTFIGELLTSISFDDLVTLGAGLLVVYLIGEHLMNWIESKLTTKED